MKKYLLILTILYVSATGCSTLKKYANIQEPRVEIHNITIKHMDFKTADLDIEIKVANNNPVSINLDGFDYSIVVEGRDFLRGEQTKKLAIKASGTSVFSFPLELNIVDLYEIYKTVDNKENIKYDLNIAAALDIPVIGKQRFPVKTEGTIPVIRVPQLTIEQLKVEKLGLTGAKLKLTTQIENPNSFDIKLNQINYSLMINGTEWVRNSPETNIDLKKKTTNRISLPFEVSFIDLGRSAYRLLISNDPLEYKLKGNFNLNTGLKYLSAELISFEKSDQIKLTK